MYDRKKIRSAQSVTDVSFFCSDVFLHDMISEKVMTNFNVLCLRVLNWVVGNLDGAFVVAVKWHLLHMNAIVLECLLHP